MIAFALIGWLICAALTSLIAGYKWRHAEGWFILGLVFGPLAILAVAVASPDRERETQARLRAGQLRRCPDCREQSDVMPCAANTVAQMSIRFLVANGSGDRLKLTNRSAPQLFSGLTMIHARIASMNPDRGHGCGPGGSSLHATRERAIMGLSERLSRLHVSGIE